MGRQAALERGGLSARVPCRLNVVFSVSSQFDYVVIIGGRPSRVGQERVSAACVPSKSTSAAGNSQLYCGVNCEVVPACPMRPAPGRGRPHERPRTRLRATSRASSVEGRAARPLGLFTYNHLYKCDKSENDVLLYLYVPLQPLSTGVPCARESNLTQYQTRVTVKRQHHIGHVASFGKGQLNRHTRYRPAFTTGEFSLIS